ncbi:MAG: hypothetical protein JNL19_00095 [Burkholderiales bacterium]|nr:hypothetical protein [Burkholderiales bacterium]
MAGMLVFSHFSHAEIVDVKWDDAGKFERMQVIAPGKFVEICENLPKGGSVAWEFKASAPLNFNVHFHRGKDVVYPEKQDGVSERQGTLAAPSKEDYCWMWTNKGTVPSDIRVRLWRVATRL